MSWAGDDWVDLHTHPFMDDGLGTLFHGHFEAELRAKDWRATTDSAINEESIEKSGLGLWVITFYAHPVVAYPQKERLRRQIERAEAFLKAHPEWVLARTPGEAARARAAGKRIVIFALETAAGILETDDDLREFIDEKGIRIVTFLHVTDDHYGGAAFFKGCKGLFMSPWAWLTQMIGGRRDETGARLNSNGLSEDGAAMVRKLIARKVWIDLSHASDEAQKGLVPLLEAAGQPLLYTHTVLRKHLHEERGITEAQVAEVAKTHGIIGVMPSEDMLDGTPLDERCPDGLHQLASQYTEIARKIGAASTVFGTDFNGGITHLGPPRCASRDAALNSSELWSKGYWNIGETGQVWAALRALSVPWPKSSGEFIENFIRTWSTFASN